MHSNSNSNKVILGKRIQTSNKSYNTLKIGLSSLATEDSTGGWVSVAAAEEDEEARLLAELKRCLLACILY